MVREVRTAAQEMAIEVLLAVFKEERLARLHRMERRHFWFSGRRVLVSGLLDRAGVSPDSGRILDAGCGTRHFAAELARRGYTVFGVDYLASGSFDSQSRGQFPILVRGSVE